MTVLEINGVRTFGVRIPGDATRLVSITPHYSDLCTCGWPRCIHISEAHRELDREAHERRETEIKANIIVLPIVDCRCTSACETPCWHRIGLTGSPTPCCQDHPICAALPDVA